MDQLQLQNEQGKALPEPRRVKRKILHFQNQAHQFAAEFSTNPNARVYNKWRKNLLQWYQKIHPYVERNDENDTYQKIKKVSDWLDPREQPSPEDLQRTTETLDQVMFDIGVTDIGARAETTHYGYEFLDGISFDMDTSDAGFQRLLQNVKNMRKMMRNDVDFFGLIWGGNRVGKDTLSLQLTRTAKTGQNESCLDEKNIVVTPDHFWQSTENLDQYGAIHIAEMSRLFYSKDAMDSDQKKRKKKLKTFAKKNMFLLGCDTQFFMIDKEVITDKFKFAIHVPRRGQFEFYSKEKLVQFEKDPNTGKAITPEPDFTGRFPKLNGDDWDLYKDMEDEKIEKKEDDEDDDGIDVHRIADEVKDDQDRYLKEHGDREIVKKSLVEADYGIGSRRAKQVKELVEADIQ